MLVSKDGKGKLMITESRQAEVRSPVMVVKLMTHLARSHTQWTLAEEYHVKGTPNGWNITLALEAPSDANRKLQDVMDIMSTEQGLEETEKVERLSGHPAIRTDVDWTAHLSGCQGADL